MQYKAKLANVETDEIVREWEGEAPESLRALVESGTYSGHVWPPGIDLRIEGIPDGLYEWRYEFEGGGAFTGYLRSE